MKNNKENNRIWLSISNTKSDYVHHFELELEDYELKQIKKLEVYPKDDEGNESYEPTNEGTYAIFSIDNYTEEYYTTDFMIVSSIMANALSIKPIGTAF